MSTINLLPDNYLQDRWQRRSNKLCIGLFMIIMMGIGAAAWASSVHTRRIEKVRDQVNASYDQATKDLARLRNLQKQKRLTIEKAKATSKLLERIPRSYVLAVLTQALPDNAALTSIQLSPTRRSVKVAAPSGTKFQAAAGAGPEMALQQIVRVEVTGLAATDMQVAGFMNNLLKDPLMDSVELGYSQGIKIKADVKDSPDVEVRQFSLRMELKAGIDVIDLIKENEPKTASGVSQGAHL